MKKSAGNDQVWFGYDIQTEKGCILKPQRIQFWPSEKFNGQTPQEPFHYHSDALVGLSLVHLNQFLKNPFQNPKMNFPFCHEAWQALEPHHELYQRSQVRVNALRAHLKQPPSHLVEYFERNFTDTLESSLHQWGINLEYLCHVVETIDYLETKIEQPILYNFNLQLSRPTLEKLHYLHSLLFNLRSLIALDYNNHCNDAAHEACKVDSITDYINKAEYVANDALLYFSFLKQSEQIKRPALQALEKAFKSYSHNGFCLIQSLPPSFLNSLRREELDESLYIVQMDWLLGTDAGLLFRIREELYGVLEGYHKVFWQDAQAKLKQHHQQGLSVNCQITLETLYPSHSVA